MATTDSNFRVKNNLEVLGTGLSTVAGSLQLAGALSGVTTAALSGQLTSTLSTGSAPLVVASTTLVTNLNADQVDGMDATTLIAYARKVAFLAMS